MKAKDLKSLIILDSKEKPKDLPVQESVMNAISKGKYEWLTMNVEIGGKITMK
jgi:hypothetical protein